MSDALRDLEQRIAAADAAGQTDQATFLRGVRDLQIAADREEQTPLSERRVATAAELESAWDTHHAQIQLIAKRVADIRAQAEQRRRRNGGQP